MMGKNPNPDIAKKLEEVAAMQELCRRANSFKDQTASEHEQLKKQNDKHADKAASEETAMLDELKNVMKKKAELEAKIGGL